METFFIYGSLKRGFPNHDRFDFDKKSRFLGEATLNGARMYDLGPFPCVVLTNDPKDAVHGEIYEVTDDECASMIRRMERGAGYVETKVEANGREAATFVYDGVQEAPAIPDGTWNGPRTLSAWITQNCKFGGTPGR